MAVFGTVASFAVPGDWMRISYPLVAQELSAQPADLTNSARAPSHTSANVMATGAALAQTGSLRALDGVESTGAVYAFLQSSLAPNTGPRVIIRDHYEHHDAMRNDVIGQLEGQGYRVADGEASFGNACGSGRCRPDILYEAPDGTVGIIEIKTGNADLSIRQTEIFPQIENGDSIPRGDVARRFGLRPGVPLREQGYPNGIPIKVREFPGAGQ
jgi:filamentous hemagglutinin